MPVKFMIREHQLFLRTLRPLPVKKLYGNPLIFRSGHAAPAQRSHFQLRLAAAMNLSLDDARVMDLDTMQEMFLADYGEVPSLDFFGMDDPVGWEEPQTEASLHLLPPEAPFNPIKDQDQAMNIFDQPLSPLFGPAHVEEGPPSHLPRGVSPEPFTLFPELGGSVHQLNIQAFQMPELPAKRTLDAEEPPQPKRLHLSTEETTPPPMVTRNSVLPKDIMMAGYRPAQGLLNNFVNPKDAVKFQELVQQCITAEFQDQVEVLFPLAPSAKKPLHCQLLRNPNSDQTIKAQKRMNIMQKSDQVVCDAKGAQAEHSLISSRHVRMIGKDMVYPCVLPKVSLKVHPHCLSPPEVVALLALNAFTTFLRPIGRGFRAKWYVECRPYVGFLFDCQVYAPPSWMVIQAQVLIAKQHNLLNEAPKLPWKEALLCDLWDRITYLRKSVPRGNSVRAHGVIGCKSTHRTLLPDCDVWCPVIFREVLEEISGRAHVCGIKSTVNSVADALCYFYFPPITDLEVYSFKFRP